MPSIQVTGQLVDPTTGVEGSADIRIASLINYGQTTKKSISHESTDASGNYDFQLVHGKHLILVKFDGDRIYNKIGYSVVGDSTPDPIGLIQLINLSDENPPSELVTELQKLREDTLNDIVSTSVEVLENAGYKGLWPNTGGSALKGETWQTQVGGTPTGEYYTALQNTSVDPVGDNVNWKVDVSGSYVNQAQEELISGSIFPESSTVQNGDTVPAGTTHLRVLVGGKPTVVAMSPVANGAVSSLTGEGAIIGGTTVEFFSEYEVPLASDIQYTSTRVGTVITTSGYYYKGDGGEGKYINRGQGWPVPVNGYSVFSDSLGNVIELQPTENGYYLAKSIGFNTDGNDNADAWDAMISSGLNNVGFAPGNTSYVYSRQIVGRSQLCIFGLVPQDKNRTAVAFRSTVAEIGVGQALIKCAPGTVQIQSFTCKDIGFIGDLAFNPDNLAAMTDTGFDAFDISGVKDGLDLSGCTFRGLSAGFNQNSGHGYTGSTNFTDQSFTGCYRAYRDLEFTTGADLSRTKIYDCKVIGVINQFAAIDFKLNNSSFSGDDAGMLFDRGVIINPWVEGFNKVFQPQEHLLLQGGYVSETSASSGSEKQLIVPADGASVEINGTRLPTNTRLFNLGNLTNYSGFNIKLKGTQNPSNPFGSLSSSISYYLQRGLKFEGDGNEKSEYNVSVTYTPNHFGSPDYTASLISAPITVKSLKATSVMTIDIDFSDVFDIDSIYRYGKINFEIIGGTDNGTTGYMATVEVAKAFGTTWVEYVDGPDKSNFTAVISNKVGSSARLTITATGGPTRFIATPVSASGNCRIQQV